MTENNKKGQEANLNNTTITTTAITTTAIYDRIIYLNFISWLMR